MVEHVLDAPSQAPFAEPSSPFFPPFLRIKQWFSLRRQARLSPKAGSLSSLADLEQLERSGAGVSRRGKILAALRGFVLGSYTVISLTLIIFSLIVLFGAVSMTALLAWYVVVPVLLLAVGLGICVAFNSVRKESVEQEKQQHCIQVNKDHTEDYEKTVDANGFAKKIEPKEWEDSLSRVQQAARDAQLTDKDIDGIIQRLADKQVEIKQSASEQFTVEKQSTQIKIDELNQTSASAQESKGWWQTFKTKLPKWGSLIRNPMGIFEGASILIGGTFLGTTESMLAGTGFTTAATGGAAVAATAVTVAVAVAHDRLVVAPRKDNIDRLEKELAIKVNAIGNVKTIVSVTHSRFLEAEQQALREIRILAEKQQELRDAVAKILADKSVEGRLLTRIQFDSDCMSNPPSYSSSPERITTGADGQSLSRTLNALNLAAGGRSASAAEGAAAAVAPLVKVVSIRQGNSAG